MELRELNSEADSRVGAYSFLYSIGNPFDQAPDRFSAGDGAEIIFYDQIGSDDRVRGVFYEGGGYRTYVQSASMVNIHHDDRTECIGRILEALCNPLLASVSY